ncbi:MAG: hypothetical protein R3B93_11040 [Bacteroidia bacterium]
MSIVMERLTSAMVIGHETSQILCIPDYVFWEQIMIRKGVRNMMSMMASRLQRTNHGPDSGSEEQNDSKYKHLEKELETAGKIQPVWFPMVLNYCLILRLMLLRCPNKHAKSGRFFMMLLVLDDERIYIAMAGDVSGKGMPKCLRPMMPTLYFLRMLISNNPNLTRSCPVYPARNNEDMMFVSIFAGVLNIRTGLLQYKWWT